MSAPSAAAEQPSLEELAYTGQFSQMLERLRDAPADHPTIDALISALERYEDNEQRRQSDRQEAYASAMAELEQKLEADEISEALGKGIEARQLADSREAFFEKETIHTLRQRAEERAEAAEDEGDWLRALETWRLLDLLKDDYQTYRDPQRRAMRHVRVLQFYVPEHLRKLQEARLQEEGDEEALANLPEMNLDEEESWQSRLDGVNMAILRQVLHWTSHRHVHGESYAHLMGGALEALRTLVHSEPLADVFPGLGDEGARDEFLAELEKLQARLDEKVEAGEAADIGFLDVSTMIDEIRLANDRTLELPEPVLVYEMTEGITGTLDEFSSVIWPQEKETFARSLEGQFSGVGIQISRRDGQLIVISPLANTPAQQAGVKAGDVIAQVDGRDASTWSLDRAVREITGEEGTVVTLGMERPGEPELIEFELERANIVIESIRGWSYAEEGNGDEWNYFIDEDERIGYIRLTQFIPQTADHLDRAIEQMQADGPIEGLILDLRHNPGGLLNAAIDVADRFLNEGTIVSTVNADGQEQFGARARAVRTYEDFPLVVLINEGSASGSEIVAGALQDYGRATIVGERSFGKGSVQDPYELDRDSAVLKLTTQYYTLPDGRIIDRQPDEPAWGILPDLLVRMTDEQRSRSMEMRQEADVLRDDEAEGDYATAADILSQGVDPQLETSLLVLKARMLANDAALALSAKRDD